LNNFKSRPQGPQQSSEHQQLNKVPAMAHRVDLPHDNILPPESSIPSRYPSYLHALYNLFQTLDEIIDTMCNLFFHQFFFFLSPVFEKKILFVLIYIFFNIEFKTENISNILILLVVFFSYSLQTIQTQGLQNQTARQSVSNLTSPGTSTQQTQILNSQTQRVKAFFFFFFSLEILFESFRLLLLLIDNLQPCQ
jgi:hypothetical protein